MTTESTRLAHSSMMGWPTAKDSRTQATEAAGMYCGGMRIERILKEHWSVVQQCAVCVTFLRWEHDNDCALITVFLMLLEFR